MSGKDALVVPSALSRSDDTKNNSEIVSDQPPTPQGPTDSHVLSQVEQDEKGLSQQAGDTAEVTDIGWSKPAHHIEEPLIAGLSNEDLWMLIRRFDTVCLAREENPIH